MGADHLRQPILVRLLSFIRSRKLTAGLEWPCLTLSNHASALLAKPLKITQHLQKKDLAAKLPPSPKLRVASSCLGCTLLPASNRHQRRSWTSKKILRRLSTRNNKAASRQRRQRPSSTPRLSALKLAPVQSLVRQGGSLFWRDDVVANTCTSCVFRFAVAYWSPAAVLCPSVSFLRIIIISASSRHPSQEAIDCRPYSRWRPNLAFRRISADIARPLSKHGSASIPQRPTADGSRLKCHSPSSLPSPATAAGPKHCHLKQRAHSEKTTSTIARFRNQSMVISPA
ncbi:hypothetical protein IWZ03DRAFT_377977, partial [Phyllosticta citriasiana]